MQPALRELQIEEREQKLMMNTEKELKRAENMIIHNKDISSRPKNTWFQSGKQRMESKKRDIQSLGDDRNASIVSAKKEKSSDNASTKTRKERPSGDAPAKKRDGKSHSGAFNNKRKK
jgi:ATP-dependent RNA helicase DDX27